AAKMPKDYYAGDPDLYLQALKGNMGIFTADGVMPKDGPDTVLAVLSAFDKNVQGKNIDLAKTFTSEFVDKANADLGPMPTMAATSAGEMAPTMAVTK